MVVDFDDAVFHRYDRHARAPVRQILGSKIDQVMKRSALVTAGNDYIADRALTAGAQNVEFVPTVIDLAHYEVGRASGSSSSPQIGWIGTPSTWAEYMAPVMGMIAALASKHGGRVLAVGAGVNAGEFGPILQTVPWTEDTEVPRIQQMDIGIMPLTDTPWARGKCGYKLIQYMACGLPVVASPVGVNANIVEHGHNGFLASTEAEWVEAIEALLVDGDLRRRMGANGRRKVEEMYSLQAWGPRVADMMESLARRNMSS
ncbi:glycosyltransferase family 4 protein [Qipengyuania gaetbuli]|uniref:glycosyltransferase family 4 protein n=1 Tax=Qipengyuania gaetbuli TaxID=266952 RepID=UPI001C997430|nr:glycosyltransferase family 4 protein [Qipengyuania gaetbuli]MBY6016078.1 glycosyltransferase family 4 protein [Qipengyuania gaetbuli]